MCFFVDEILKISSWEYREFGEDFVSAGGKYNYCSILYC